MVRIAGVRIGRWQLDPASDHLVLADRVEKIEPRLTRLLLVLANAGGQVVTHPELMARVWAPAVVSPGSIHEAVARLRAILAADASTSSFIATVPRRGYRLVAPVQGAVDDAWPRLAVLPFRSGGLPASFAPLRERLLDGLIGELSRIAPCRVLARATVLADDFDPVDLGTRFIVDGSLHTDSRRIVVEASLVDAACGEVIGAETVKLPLADGPALAPPVVERIARALNLRLPSALAGSADAGLSEARREAARSWRDLFCRPQSAQTNQSAWQSAQAALALDGDDALANVSMAYAAWRGGNYGWRPEGRGVLHDAALRHAERALAVDPGHADAHFVRALVAFSRGDFVAADQGMRDAAVCAPSHAPAFGLLARIRCVLGHPEETVALVEHAVAISPLEPLRAVWYWSETLSRLALGDHELALASGRRALAMNPENANAWFCAIAAARAAGDAAQAAEWVAAFRARLPASASLAGLGRIAAVEGGPAYARQMAHYRSLLREAGLPEQ